MPLKITPQVCNYILIGLLFSPLQLKSPFFATERCASPAKSPDSHSVSSFSPSLLSALGRPRQKEEKKNAVLVAGDQQERRQQHAGGLGWERGRWRGRSSAPPALLKISKCKELIFSKSGYGILTLGPGYPIGPSIPGSPLREEDTES